VGSGTFPKLAYRSLRRLSCRDGLRERQCSGLQLIHSQWYAPAKQRGGLHTCSGSGVPADGMETAVVAGNTVAVERCVGSLPASGMVREGQSRMCERGAHIELTIILAPSPDPVPSQHIGAAEVAVPPMRRTCERQLAEGKVVSTCLLGWKRMQAHSIVRRARGGAAVSKQRSKWRDHTDPRHPPNWADLRRGSGLTSLHRWLTRIEPRQSRLTKMAIKLTKIAIKLTNMDIHTD
jgi:hypothetical protein